MKVYRIIVVFLLFSLNSVFSQESDLYKNSNVTFEKALLLYKRENYRPAVFFFEEIQDKLSNEIDKENCRYYIASSLLRLRQEAGELKMQDFINKYPSSFHIGRAYIDLANYYFEKADYVNAQQWYQKSDQRDVQKQDLDKYYFQRGYSLFATGEESQSHQFFSSVGKQSQFKDKSNYYLGYIAYSGEDYQKAKELFNSVGDNNLNQGISYYKANMNFKEGKFEDAIREGIDQLSKTTDQQEISQINKIVGESYFNLKKHEESIPYLEKYKGKDGVFDHTDYYLLGYAYYQKKEYQKAIGQFNKIINGQNQIAQNAYYNLADCYLKLDKKQEALNAFRNSSQMDFNAEIKRESLLNYAKLSYEIGNAYESVPLVIQNYINMYPQHNTQQMRELLIDSYISSGDYTSAISILENSKSPEDAKIYNKVCFYRGIELYDKGEYAQAVEFFNKSKKADSAIGLSSYFWSAEVNYLLYKYEQSEQDLLKFFSFKDVESSKEYVDALYSLAYCQFNQKKFEQAIENFEKYIEKKPSDNNKVVDSKIRKADSYFALGKYWPAMDQYREIIEKNEPQADYASYQKAISYGFVGRNEKKLEELNFFVGKYVDSNLREQALFELANTYVVEGDSKKGLDAYKKIQREYKNGAFAPRSMVREGLIYYNTGDNQKALDVLKQVATTYPRTNEAIEASNTVKSIYSDMGQVDEYARWAKDLGYIEITDSEIDNASFESAEKNYIQNKTKEATSGFEKYLLDFPKGIHTTQASFYLGQLYFNQNKKKEAKPLYERVILDRTFEFREQTLTKLSSIYLTEKDDKKAEVTLKELEKISTIEQNVLYAKSNLMKIYYDRKNYKQALDYAQEILQYKSLDNRIKNDATIIIARSFVETAQEEKAEKYYAEIRKNATGETMAEAIYYDAYFKNKSGSFKKSNQIIQKLAKDYGGYKEISAKGLILMAKNFRALNDNYQATYILNSVIENFSDYKEITQEAESILNEMKTKK